jgi:hypothetical protein
MLNWVFSQLWHNIVYYWIGALTNSPQKLIHYVGVFRGVLGAGEAIIFGLDSIKIPYIAEAGGILLFYVIGICVFYYLGVYHIKDILEGEGSTPGQRKNGHARTTERGDISSDGVLVHGGKA